MSPYFIHGPALISFSGGRTSGFMLKHIIDAHGGVLPPDVRVAMANTGREHEETLKFWRACQDYWHVEIPLLEYATQAEHRTLLVDFDTASRNGEPFSAVIRQERMLPNPVARLCTKNLKVRRLHAYARHWLGWTRWTSVVGLRSDEKRAEKVVEDRYLPLKLAGVTKADVLSWWKEQPFDLGLPVNDDGEAVFGNCDGCFLMSRKTLHARFSIRPEVADWWIEEEANAPGLRIMQNPAMAMFRSDRPSYRRMKAAVLAGEPIPSGKWSAELDCACTD